MTDSKGAQRRQNLISRSTFCTVGGHSQPHSDSALLSYDNDAHNTGRSQYTQSIALIIWPAPIFATWLPARKICGEQT